jgi:deoxyadenosine/deoxycytidine kinase|tara:strand:- start:759 stop:1412 length:654 start_codon:yes stop_codon:yes gene_type:complete
MQPFNVVTVEGNIGVGKSTLLPKLADELTRKTSQRWVCFKEEVDTDPTFQKLLKAFTDDPKTHRVAFQDYMTELRHGIGKSLKAGTNYILERSLLSDLVFSEANAMGPDGDRSHITRIHDALNDYVRIDTVLYLQASAQSCYMRMMQRGRDAEKGTELSYIEHIANCHDTLLPKFAKQYNAPLLTVEYSQFKPVEQIAQMVLDNMSDQVRSEYMEAI